jgi:septal ring factor EnvC (AmiA/AmiB activator)
MPAQRIAELELQLATANEAVAKMTLENAGLAEQLSDAETRLKKLKRNARSDESSLRSQLAVAQSRRG